MEAPQKQRNWFARHKVLTVILAFIVLSIIASAGSQPSNTQTVLNKQTGETTAGTPTPQAEKMTISNSVAKQTQFGFTQVDGEIKNNDTAQHSASLKATFYDKAGKIVGTATGAVNDVDPGDTKTFTLMTTESVASYDHMKVQVDTLL